MTSNPDFTKATLLESLQSLRQVPVLIVGDLMLDRYIFGNVDRISPEAPVPVVSTTHERSHLGGAGNVAKNIKKLGGSPMLISVCGEDEESGILREALDRQDISASLIPDGKRPTTVKTRIIAHNQQVVRFDRESTIHNSPSVTVKILEAIESFAGDGSVVIVSDYGKGMVTRELMAGLKEISAGKNEALHVLIDPKPVNIELYDAPYLMTPNSKEAATSAGMHAVSTHQEIIQAGRAIQDRIHCRNLLITLGARGMALFEESAPVWHVPAMAQEVYDVTGAGDTVIAMMGLALASGQSLLVSSLLANYAAGIVVGEVGAATATLQQIAEVIDRWPLPEVVQWESAPR